LGERASLGALPRHVDRHVDRTIGRPTVGREDLCKTAVDVGNVAVQQCLNLRDMRSMLARLKGFLPISARPVKPVPNPTIRRPGAICSSVAMAEA
jgi:hypothetical protein